MSSDEMKDEAFEAIQGLALEGKALTKDAKLSEILDNIVSLTRYKYDVVNYRGRKKNT
jgi:hypothetical protein